MTRLYLSPPELTGHEGTLLAEALASGWIAPLGPRVDAFEAAMSAEIRVPHALALSSGTAALHLALLAVGTQPGDRVLVSTLTFAATANAVRYCGATPVFVDADESWNMSPMLLDQALTNSRNAGQATRAVIAVGLYGSAANMAALLDVCRKHGVWMIEDAAEALGATHRGQAAGSFGDLAAFSFNGNKIITTSGGGMLMSGRSDWISRARHLATQAREPARHYEHNDIGYNYRMSNLLAAVGCAQLTDLSRRVERKRRIRDRYAEALAPRGWTFQPDDKDGRATFWLTCATVPGGQAARDRALDTLAALDIEARPVWKPMHLQPVFRDTARVVDGTSERLFTDGICLPSGSSMTDEDLARVINALI